jgi:molybdopterin converting factor small subunit
MNSAVSGGGEARFHRAERARAREAFEVANSVAARQNLLRKERLYTPLRSDIKAADMQVAVHFYSYFKDLTGCARTTETLAPGSRIADLMCQLAGRFPQMGPMQKSTLIAVGVDYQTPDYLLRDGDEVSLFPPVQGG